MARVNLWLRGTTGKFAGSTLQKGSNGETIARETVTPTNPNTDAQKYQRAIMATVMRAYSEGKEIFDHSFQGKSKGSECQQEFMKLNLHMLRQGIATDLEKEPKDQTHAVTAPGIKGTSPNPYIISQGNYPQYFFKGGYKKNNSDKIVGTMFSIPSINSATTLGQYCSEIGLIPGDLYTVVAFVLPSSNLDYLYFLKNELDQYDGAAVVYNLSFNFYRYLVKEDVLTSTKAIGEATLGDIFVLNESKESYPMPSDEWEFGNGSLDLSTTITAASTDGIDSIDYGCIGIIRSRIDEDLRSNTTMLTSNMENEDTAVKAGIIPELLLEAWSGNGEKIGNSNLILES